VIAFPLYIKTSFVKELGVSLALNNILDKKYEANGYTYSYKKTE